MTLSGSLRIVVVGARGRMGRFACELLERTAQMDVVAEVAREEDLIPTLESCDARVGLDVTRAGLGTAHGMTMLECGVRPVIGTSGVGAAEAETLDRRALELGLGGIIVPNFSVGMWLLQRAACLAAAHMPAVEILELHHERKVDAPSGTALDTAERLRAERKDDAEVPIHSVRLPGLYAHQEVLFGAPGETFTLRHDMRGPEAFGPGLLAALRYAATATGVARGIGTVFNA
jgi:4-hydroxy-tetrahydrodipicolinate reductase